MTGEKYSGWGNSRGLKPAARYVSTEAAQVPLPGAGVRASSGRRRLHLLDALVGESERHTPGLRLAPVNGHSGGVSLSNSLARTFQA